MQPWKLLVEYLSKQRKKALRRSRLRMEGRELWKDFRRNLAKSTSYVPSQEADERAIRAVRRFAPEARFLMLGRYDAVIRGNGITATDGEMNGECCRYTFGFAIEDGCPFLERALTLYLWQKLFPKRFSSRGVHPKWKTLP